MEKCIVTPYEGQDSYIFASYCHKDSAKVYPIIENLNSMGYRIWYDEGIVVGSEWPEAIANYMGKAAVCIIFISKNSVNSHNCRREINFALLKKKPLITVFLEQVELTPGMELQLSTTQAIFEYKVAGDEFYGKFSGAYGMKACMGQKTPNLRDAVADTGEIENSESVEPASAEPADVLTDNGAEVSAGTNCAEEAAALSEPGISAGILPATDEENMVFALVDLKSSDIHCITKEATVIGRADDADISVKGNISISRYHAKLSKTQKEVSIEDLNSINYTYVNGVKAVPHTPISLCNKDILRLGTQVFAYMVADDEHTIGIGSDFHAGSCIYQESNGEKTTIDSTPFLIGRSAVTCNFVIHDNKTIGREHASIIKELDGFYLQDNHSRNGTKLNGERIPADVKIRLHDHDKITISDETLVFHIINQEELQ